MAASVRVTILAVGQGMSNLIEVFGTNGKMQQLILVDCGGDSLVHPYVKDSVWLILRAMNRRAAAMGKSSRHRHLDILVLSHQDKDHHSILKDMLSRFDTRLTSIGEFWSFDENYCVPSTSYTQCRDEISRFASAEYVCSDGSCYDATGEVDALIYESDEADLLYLYCNARGGDTNNTVSCVAQLDVHIKAGEVFRFLFPGDPTTRTMSCISALTLPGSYTTDYISAPHHGSIVTCSATSLSAFMRKIKPMEMVVSAGEGNSYGHPHKTFMSTAEANLRGQSRAKHDYYYNTTDGSVGRIYDMKSTKKFLYTIFNPQSKGLRGVILGQYYHFVYHITSTGADEGMTPIKSRPGDIFAFSKDDTADKARPWHKTAKPGMAERR